MRSYAGTAKWEGGDPECDHEAARKRTRFDYPLDEKQNSNAGSDLRIYGDFCPTCGARRHDAQLGSEPLHDCLGWATGNDCGECYICHMRQVARECWRVLRDDGVMFWNIADSYASAWGSGGRRNLIGNPSRTGRSDTCTTTGLKEKDKCGIPERTALAFQADGWWWRSSIIWHKPNPMPESVTDRPTKSHEFVYVFTKAERYFWDSEAVKEGNSAGSIERFGIVEGIGQTRKWDTDNNKRDGRDDGTKSNEGFRDYVPAGRNLRDVWTLATAPYSGAHFATFPPELPRRCIKAGTSERGACPKCGKPWERVVERGELLHDRPDLIATTHGTMGKKYNEFDQVGWDATFKPRHHRETNTLGWRPACTCDAGDPVPCVVLDPFSGAGTTILVARELGRHGIGLELSGEYLQQSRERLGLAALDAWDGGNGKAHETDVTGLPLFGGVK